MITNAAARARDFERRTGVDVYTFTELERMGCTRSTARARVAARRWQRLGRAFVLHHGELTREQRWAVGVINCGPRAVLASFSAAESLGLTGWERDETYVLAPVGVVRPVVPGLRVVLRRSRLIGPASIAPAATRPAGDSYRTRPVAAGTSMRSSGRGGGCRSAAARAVRRW